MTSPSVRLVFAPESRLQQPMTNRFNSPCSRESQRAGVRRALAAALSSQNAAAGEAGPLNVEREPALRLGADEICPALAAWSRDTPIHSRQGEPILDVPVWVCEITSQASARESRVVRQGIYRRERIRFVWQLDLDLHTLETFHLHDGRLTEVGSYSDDDRVRAAPFEGIELDLAALWAELEE